MGKRLELLCRLLSRTQQLIDVEARIQKRVSEQIDKSQKEYYLREQIRAIQKELGDREAGDIEEYRRKAKTLPLNDEARDKVQREIDRLEAMAPGTPEMGVSSAYIEWILALPWGKRQTAAIDPLRARKALDKDHFGLDKVKERLVEYLAVRALKNDDERPVPVPCRPARRGQDVNRAVGGARAQAAAGRMCRWAACATRPRFAAIAAPMWARYPAA